MVYHVVIVTTLMVLRIEILYLVLGGWLLLYLLFFLFSLFERVLGEAEL